MLLLLVPILRQPVLASPLFLVRTVDAAWPMLLRIDNTWCYEVTRQTPKVRNEFRYPE
jgi:hypothetical protein